MVKLMETRIKGLDDFLGGGIRPGSSLLLISPPLIETRLLCLEYIYRGLEVEESGLVVTTDSSPEELKERASEYSWDLEVGEKKGMLKWVDVYSPRTGELSDTEPKDGKAVTEPRAIRRISSQMSLSDIMIAQSQALRELHSGKGCCRFVFNSLSSILIHYLIEGQQGAVLRLLERMTPKLRSNKVTGIFTLTKGIHDYTVENTLKHMLDGTIEIDDKLNVTAIGLSTGSYRGPVRMNLGKTGFEFLAVDG